MQKCYYEYRVTPFVANLCGIICAQAQQPTNAIWQKAREEDKKKEEEEEEEQHQAARSCKSINVKAKTAPHI